MPKFLYTAVGIATVESCLGWICGGCPYRFAARQSMGALIDLATRKQEAPIFTKYFMRAVRPALFVA